MTRRSLFALLLAPLAKYLPAKAKPVEWPMYVGIDVAAGKSYTVTNWMFYCSNGEVWEGDRAGWRRISFDAYPDGKPPFVLLDQKAAPWKTL